MYEPRDHLRLVRVGAGGALSTLHLDTETSEVMYASSSRAAAGDPRGWDDALLDENVRFRCTRAAEPATSVVLLKVTGAECRETLVGPDDAAGDGARYEFSSSRRQRRRHLFIPDVAMTRCQNCETYFPTKYQYQRHQCEFNADKVVLKPEAAARDADRAARLRFECGVCSKSFVSSANLERHRSCHAQDKSNVCEHCQKTFVSDNRLRIHKENHCKKAGDTTKFYRSDVVVWRCGRCSRVFANERSGAQHARACASPPPPAAPRVKSERSEDEPAEPPLARIRSVFSVAAAGDNNFDESFERAMVAPPAEQPPPPPPIGFYRDTSGGEGGGGAAGAGEEGSPGVRRTLTEMLYQCEFCNRTYASKDTVLAHQRAHGTRPNYECVFCGEGFAGFAQAASHWLNRCNHESNLFYLPKLVYCEQCDRGYKSHEILYAHKNKKKHFTAKRHDDEGGEGDAVGEGEGEGLESAAAVTAAAADPASAEGEDKAIVQFIQNMIIKYERGGGGGGDGDGQPGDGGGGGTADTGSAARKRRGRKRKQPRPDARAKRRAAPARGHKFQCERCGQVFDDVAAMDAHKERDHVSTFSCEQCGQVVHSAKALVIHCRAHQCLKPYVCDQCGRSYSQTSHLWQHMRFHQGIKPFACPHEGCEARYTIRPDLKDHIRKVHTRERPFKCAVCHKCFLTGSVYYQHRLIHTNDRRYGCEICQKRFFRADALNNHRRIHTDERPYPCPVCGREFRQKGDRNKHVRTQHPI